MRVSIIIPVLNKREFTQQCLDRIARNTGDEIPYEVIVVDNGSSDGTLEWFSTSADIPVKVRYHRNDRNLGFAKANNIGARLARGRWLLFLNNDTLVQPGWLSEMVRVGESNPSIGVVGIKQLFPYTNIIYHTGVVFAPGGVPQHLYPHLDASLPHVNKEREYQAVTGACLMIDRALFEACGGFDEAYLNGYEDTDLCLAVAEHGRRVVCCTSAFIYHYGQISEGRARDDVQNAERFARKWKTRIRVDRDRYLAADRADARWTPRPAQATTHSLPKDCIYLADDLGQGSALTWVNAAIALALHDRGVPVLVNGAHLSSTLPSSVRRRLQGLVARVKPVGGVQIKWSHYRPSHLNLELAGDANMEMFVINYLFDRPGAEPWDYWLQGIRQNHHDKLPISGFCRDVLLQLGLPDRSCHVLHLGYSLEIPEVEAPRRRHTAWRFLTVTNSHDLERYNTAAILDAYDEAFGPGDDVALVIKDYGASSGNTTIARRLSRRRHGARVDYVNEFTDKRELIRLYKSCDAFVSAHRGEGFGMKILDAMACGLPVLSPLFGGPTAFCRTDNCFPVDFALTPMGDCLDTRSLHITNGPTWAEVDRTSLVAQMRRVVADPASARRLGAHGRDTVIDEFSWSRVADRLLEITTERGAEQRCPERAAPEAIPQAELSPYWLGLRVSVIVPTRNRREKLLACLEALSRQSVLPQEYEVIVVDDGSDDGTAAALEGCQFPFTLRHYRQEAAGPGAARNLGIERAVGELVLFIGDDICADPRLLEEHLLAHASRPEPGVAILGHIDWPPTMTPNAVMEYICGDAMLQFAYSYIPHAPDLDHRFFYTSNISVKRRFLVDAADAGIRFDPCFRRAAFEDSEFAFRLIPRGLRIRYAPSARVIHDHWTDLEGFARREFTAGEMAVVFYRKHPGQDDHLQVRWIADLVLPASKLLAQPDLLRRLERFDSETDALLRALAGSIEDLLLLQGSLELRGSTGGSEDGLHAALHNVFGVIFDVERTRGKIQEWYSTVTDPAQARAAQTLAGVTRKIAFLNSTTVHAAARSSRLLESDVSALTALGDRLASGAGLLPGRANHRLSGHGALKQVSRRLILNAVTLPTLLRMDRFMESRLQSMRPSWLSTYRRVRTRIRRALA